MTCTSGVIATSALVGITLASNSGYATVPLACQFSAGMLATMPASLFMKLVGRKIGFLTGTGFGIAGILISTYAILSESFILFCLGSALFGCFAGFSRYFRFAAAEAASADFRSKAISLVLAGGVVAAFTGPTLARATVDLFAPILFAGTYAALVVVQMAIIGVVSLISLPPQDETERSGEARPLIEIIRQPIFIVALLGSTLSYAVMSFLMSITPVAMREHHFDFTDSTFVIQGHILGMYLPAFFTGHLIARFGVLEVMLAGACLLAGCVCINLAGTDFVNFVMALTLVGVKPHRPDKVKTETYECGMETVGGSWVRFNFRYYFFAISFLIFDVEAVFLFPWAVHARELSWFGFGAVNVFVAIITLGLLYEWKKKALEWR